MDRKRVMMIINWRRSCDFQRTINWGFPIAYCQLRTINYVQSIAKTCKVGGISGYEVS